MAFANGSYFHCSLGRRCPCTPLDMPWPQSSGSLSTAHILLFTPSRHSMIMPWQSCQLQLQLQALRMIAFLFLLLPSPPFSCSTASSYCPQSYCSYPNSSLKPYSFFALDPDFPVSEPSGLFTLPTSIPVLCYVLCYFRSPVYFTCVMETQPIFPFVPHPRPA